MGRVCGLTSRNEISKLLKTSRNTIRKVENAAKSIRLF